MKKIMIEQQGAEDRLTAVKNDFRLFVFVLWKHLGLPDPTRIQYDIAQFLQHGPSRGMISAFRGVGKSWLTSAYVVWLLLRDPDLKIMVVSASKERADAFSVFVKRIISELEFCRHLIPQKHQRNSAISFDVGPAKPDHSPSVKSVGITGQITGSRADIIIADDVEVANNSDTQVARDKLSEAVKEFSAILKPDPGPEEKRMVPRIIYLGTPQTEDSLYNKLPERGYTVTIWPAEMPKDEDLPKYGDTLAPIVFTLDLKTGEPVDPQRFNEEDLRARKAEYGRAGYQLQFMLNTSLSDEERYPLKMADLLVTPLDSSKAPMGFTWMPHPDRRLSGDTPNMAMNGDYFYWPQAAHDITMEYEGIVMSIDPSGRGKDETGYAIVAQLNGYQFVLACGGFQGGYDRETVLKPLAMLAAKYKVSEIVVESNFGDGMFNEIFLPVLRKIHHCGLEEVRSSTQKERRIADTLEPVMNSHKLVIDPQVIQDDYKSIQKYESEVRSSKSLIYQMSRLTRDKGCLRHDDRLDALAMAVAYWSESMAKDELQGIQDAHEEALMEEMDKIHEAWGWKDVVNQPQSTPWGGTWR
jgi:hypothetical protein